MNYPIMVHTDYLLQEQVHHFVTTKNHKSYGQRCCYNQESQELWTAMDSDVSQIGKTLLLERNGSKKFELNFDKQSQTAISKNVHKLIRNNSCGLQVYCAKNIHKRYTFP